MSSPDPHTLVRRQFGAHARQYVASAVHARGESLARLVALVQPQPSWQALDIGTGGGHTALALAPHVREVIATDITPAMLAAAASFVRGQGVANVSFRQADAGALPFPDAALDLVTCRLAAHHFPDCPRFVREAARVLRPGGIFAMVDNVTPVDADAARYINAFEQRRDPSHRWASTVPEWLAMLSAAGFTPTATELFRKPMDFAAYCDRMSVPPAIRAELRTMLADAPPTARESLAPSQTGDRLTFCLLELLLVASR
jgi:ubiquinone/menaquinone biosynthesis C-methylase UbiE